jgi:serine/threonine protein kinase
VTSEEPDRIGQVFLGKLQVIRRIGGGGMGDVYEVEHLITRHRRALKIVRSEYAKQRRFIERLLREASIAGRLRTPFVVETLDAGRLEDDSAYILMELLDGRSLHEIIGVDGGLSQRRLANLMCQVAEGIGVAHAAGIVHRDIKPENVFVVNDVDGFERVKILDFGVSKILEGEEATRLTREGSVLGTPFYMSPEQAAGRTIDERTDIWALGVVMYEALTEKLPFDGRTVGEVLLKIGAGLYAPLESRRPDLDRGFVAIVQKALKANPLDRYPNAEAMRRDLLPFASSEPVARAKTISDGVRAEVISDRPLPPPGILPIGTFPPPAGRDEEVTASAPFLRESSEITTSTPFLRGSVDRYSADEEVTLAAPFPVGSDPKRAAAAAAQMDAASDAARLAASGVVAKEPASGSRSTPPSAATTTFMLGTAMVALILALAALVVSQSAAPAAGREPQGASEDGSPREVDRAGRELEAMTPLAPASAIVDAGVASAPVVATEGAMVADDTEIAAEAVPRTAGPRTPERGGRGPRTRAEQVGLEGNPYGSP